METGGEYIDAKADLTVIAGFTVAFAVLRRFLTKLVFEPMADRLLQVIRQPKISTMNPGSKGKSKALSRDLKLVKEKFVVSAWKAAAFGSLLTWGVVLLLNQPFVYDSALFWRNWPEDVAIPPSLKRFYLAELAWYVFSLLVLFVEPRTTDFVQMVVHHVSTIALIVLSYLLGFWKIGMVIMTLHDIVDPVLETGKLCLYLRLAKIADIMLGLFALLFGLSRCVLFPLWILNTVYSESLAEIPPEKVHNIPYHPTWLTFNVFLWILQVLNFLWMWTIAVMVVDAVKSAATPGDPREIGDA